MDVSELKSATFLGLILWCFIFVFSYLFYLIGFNSSYFLLMTIINLVAIIIGFYVVFGGKKMELKDGAVVGTILLFVFVFVSFILTMPLLIPLLTLGGIGAYAYFTDPVTFITSIVLFFIPLFYSVLYSKFLKQPADSKNNYRK